MASQLHLGDSNWTFFHVGYPVDIHTQMSFLLRVSVTHRPARSILGRWKERSLRMKPPSLPIVQGISRPTKGIRNTFWHTGTQCEDENKGEKLPSLPLFPTHDLSPGNLRKRKGNQQKKQKVYTNPQQKWIHKKGRRGKMKKGKKNKRTDMANTEREGKNEKREERYNYRTINKYPCPA